MPAKPENSPAPIPPPWRWTKRIAKSLLLLLILLSAIRWAWGRYADAQLKQAINDTRRPGEPFFAEDFNQPPIPDSENAAMILELAAAIVTPAPATAEDFHDFETAPLADKIAVRFWVGSNGVALTRLRGIRGKRADWKSDFSQGVQGLSGFVGTPLKDRKLADLALLAAKSAHATGDDAAAVELWRDVVTEAQVIRQRPTLLNYKFAARVDELACLNIIDRASELRIGPPPSASTSQAAALIAQLLDEAELSDRRTRMVCAWRWLESEAWRAILSENGSLEHFGEIRLGPPFFWQRTVLHTLRPTFTLKLARGIRFNSSNLQAANSQDYPTALSRLPKWISEPHTSIFLADHAEKFGDVSLDFQQFLGIEFRLRLERRAAAMTMGMRLYQIDHSGALPKNAALLVPQYLPALPNDPFDSTSHPIRYEPTKFGRPVLYSLGPLGVDIANQKFKLPAQRIDSLGRTSYVFELSPPFPASSPK